MGIEEGSFYGHYKYFDSHSAGIDNRRQNLI